MKRREEIVETKDVEQVINHLNEEVANVYAYIMKFSLAKGGNYGAKLFKNTKKVIEVETVGELWDWGNKEIKEAGRL